MQFNSYLFIFLVLPIFVLAYFLANKIRLSLGKIVMIVFSVLFYAFERKEMLAFLGISMIINFSCAVIIKKKNLFKKWMLFLPVAVNVGLLLYFKYTNFAITIFNQSIGTDFGLKDIILPLGISFYTFQQIAYIVSVYKKEIATISIIDYLSFILFFPKLIMGPLMEPVDFIQQINDTARKNFNVNNLACGIKIFSFGLLKKVLIADTFSGAVSLVYSHMENATSMDCILLVLFYTFEIYFDFSGYSDMAVGISSMINIDLPINFDSPYKALSIRDFWKRWHISLTRFLTKYIYIPLGGSRKGKAITYLNVMIVFIVSGLWHGANLTFVLWGFLHGLFSCLERACEKIYVKIFEPVRWIITFTTVSFLWLLFSAPTISEWIIVIKRICHMQNTTVSEGLIDAFVLPEKNFFINTFHLGNIYEGTRGFCMIVFIIASFIICLIPENNFKNKNKLNVASVIFSAIAFIWGVLCLGKETVFVYFGF